jgi:PAS domain S-box-containing protein
MRLLWLTGGATAQGIGTWSMHYIGMLAFSLPVPIEYDWPTVLVSLLTAILSSALALFVVSRQTMGAVRVGAASIFMGGGISTLHYTSMAAMRLQGVCHYSPLLVTLSVVLAIAFSLISLQLTFFFRNQAPGGTTRRVASALLMGAAICGMHYTGMAAASFKRAAVAVDRSHAVSISSLGAAGIGVVALMVLGIALLTSLVDRLHRQGAFLAELFEQAPEAVALTSTDDRVIQVNREFTRIFGYAPEETLGGSLADLIVPDESQHEVQQNADRVAHEQRVDGEGVRRRKDGSRLHVSMVQVPVSVNDGPIALYAIYRDITSQKEADSALHRLSGRLLRSQDEERRRIARDLHDSTAQLLAGLAINLAVVSGSANELNPRAQGALGESVALADECLREIRTVSYLLHPPELDQLGLQSALARYIGGFAQRSGIQTELEMRSEIGRLPQNLETALFRIVQESLTNIHRHSGSETARIVLVRSASDITLEVKDAGRGISRNATPGVGIASMRERVQQLGGQLEVNSQNSGTTVKAVIPLANVAP